ncbi:unnamed protein product [Ilex paraguariensis]|uniref:Uncharacterized protein n=1 Tax=Ilex paraguariensis TaxID=185542 RepID=A0ABC8QUN6_9AQUA
MPTVPCADANGTLASALDGAYAQLILARALVVPLRLHTLALTPTSPPACTPLPQRPRHLSPCLPPRPPRHTALIKCLARSAMPLVSSVTPLGTSDDLASRARHASLALSS